MMNKAPLLAIRCLTYNHEHYIRQCLEGFIIQKTTFPFIAIVHDDASTDKTAEIIEEYALKYPDIIKPILEKENQYSKHDGSLGRILNNAIPESVKYIAMCEGDDYWTDPLKLQIQVDFLENHPDYGLVHTDFCVKIESKNKYFHHGSKFYGYKFSNGDIFYELFQGCFIKTLTVCYRNSLLPDIPILPNGCFNGDLFLFYEIASKSKIQYFDYESGVYRQLPISASHCINEKSRGKVFDSYRKLDYYYAEKHHIPEHVKRNLDKKWYIYDVKHYIKMYDYAKFKLLCNSDLISKKDRIIYLVVKLCKIKPLFYITAIVVNLKARCQLR